MSYRRFLKATLNAVGAGHDIADIACEVSAKTGIPVNQILARPRGTSPISCARQEVYRRAAASGFSLSAIGRFFNRDHTTIIHGVKAAQRRLKT